MLRPRIVPSLLLCEENLVKGVNFKNHIYIGNAMNAVRIFNAKEADEIILLDISATRERRIPNLKLLNRISQEIFMPFAVGGGIRTIEDAKKILSNGAEKVVINSAAFECGFIKRLSKHIGRQSVVISIDVIKNSNGEYSVLNKGKLNHVEWAKHVEKEGAGEIIITSVNKEGTGSSYDIDLIRDVSDAVNIPVVAAGGAGCDEDFRKALKDGRAHGVSAGSFFVFFKKSILINYPDKNRLEKIRRFTQ